MVQVIGEKMNVRARGFVARQLAYITANGRDQIDSQVAYAGSRATERFTGWVEQDEGASAARERIFAGKKGRTRGGRGIAKQKYRFTKDKSIPHNQKAWGGDDYMSLANGDAGRAAVIMTAILKRKGYVDKPFVIEGASFINDGVYVMTPGGKLRWVATLDTKHNVRELPWKVIAFKRALRAQPLALAFHREMESQLKKRYKGRLKGRGK
jgi:hypothetical protein